MNSKMMWHKSSYSGADEPNCLEAAEGPHTLVRDTQHRDHGHLDFPAAEWQAFVTSVKGEANDVA